MIVKKIEMALNDQINAEFWSAYLYLSMSNNFESAGSCTRPHGLSACARRKDESSAYR